MEIRFEIHGERGNQSSLRCHVAERREGEKLPDTRFGSFNAKDESAPIRLANMFRVYAPSLDSSSSNEFLKYSKKNLLKRSF